MAKSPTAQKHQLLKILGVAFGLAIGIGAAVGVGILRTPGIVAHNLGQVWLILAVWVFVGIYNLICANTLAELATMLPKDGGGYVYFRRAYGNFFGFAGGANDVILTCCGAAYISIIFGEYLAVFFPSLSGHENFVAVGVQVFLMLINAIGLRAGDFAQKLVSFAKVAALLILVAACFIFGGNAHSTPDAPTVSLGNPLAVLGAIALSLQAVWETYAGWNSAIYFSEENTDPARAIPRSLFLGVVLVMTIYVLVNAALLYVLPVSQIAQSKLPAADAAQAVFGAAGGKIITALALCSVLGILNAIVLYLPRAVFAMSRDGLLPLRASAINAGGTPIVALLTVVSLTIMFALTGTFETLLSIAAFLGLAGDSAQNLTLFVLRIREPDLPRPFRAVGYPFLPAIVVLGGLILLVVYVVGNTLNSLYSIGILLLLYPTFIAFRRVSKG